MLGGVRPGGRVTPAGGNAPNAAVVVVAATGAVTTPLGVVVMLFGDTTVNAEAACWRGDLFVKDDAVLVAVVPVGGEGGVVPSRGGKRVAAATASKLFPLLLSTLPTN